MVAGASHCSGAADQVHESDRRVSQEATAGRTTVGRRCVRVTLKKSRSASGRYRHPRCRPKPCLSLTNRDESDALVEADCLGVRYDVDPRRAPLTRDSLRVVDESTPDAGAHPIRFDEEAVQLARAGKALEQDGETDDEPG